MKTIISFRLLKKILPIFYFIVMLPLLNFSQTAIWNGSQSSNWSNSQNWNIEMVPDSTYDIIIPNTYINKLIVDGIQSAKNITVDSNAEIDVTLGASIYVKNNINLYGTLNMDNGHINVLGTGHNYPGGLLNVGTGSFSVGTAILDSLSTTHYRNENPLLYNWDYGILIIEAPETVDFQGTYNNPTICDSLVLYSPVFIGQGNALEVQGGINILSKSNILTIDVGSDNSGILIHNNSNVLGHVNIVESSKKNKSIEWHYISSPVSNAQVSFISESVYEWNSSETWGGEGDYSPWSITNDSYLQKGKGYALRTNPYSLSFEGYLNVKKCNITLHNSGSGNSESQGWNLIGNPYVAPLNWEKVIATGNFPAGVEKAIYFFDDNNQNGSASNYRYYVPANGHSRGVGTGNASQFIPVCQGFFIKSNIDNTTLTLKPSHRSRANAHFYKNMKAPKIISFTIDDGINSDELIFRIVEDATIGFDVDYDARKLSPTDNSIPLIYSVNFNDEISEIAINSIPNTDKYTVLNIGINAKSGDYTINLKDLNIDAENVYLIDKYKNKTIDLRKETSYSFTHEGGIVSDRFCVTFAKTQTTVIDENQNIMIDVFPNPASEILNIQLESNKSECEMNIYSTKGILVNNSKLSTGNNKIDISNLSSGIYILKLNFKQNNSIIKKIVVK